VSELTKDQLEECTWEDATHTIMPDGGIGEITKYGLEYKKNCVPFADRSTWGALGFTPYRDKKAEVFEYGEYTLHEAFIVDGVYVSTCGDYRFEVTGDSIPEVPKDWWVFFGMENATYRRVKK